MKCGRKALSAFLIVGSWISFCVGALQAQTYATKEQKDASAEVTPTQQTPADASQGNEKHTRVTIYPILAWAPVFGASFNLPQPPGGGGGEGGIGGSGTTDTSFNGAALTGARVETDKFLFDFGLMWAGLSASRKTPVTQLDVDFVYGEVDGGYRVYKDFYAMGGVRRIALDLHAKLTDEVDLRRKPGFWDPLIGVLWRRKLSRSWTATGNFYGGGFGVGSDVDLSGQIHADWQFAHFFEVMMGYGFLHIKNTETIVNRTFTLNQTLNGPIFGFGICF